MEMFLTTGYFISLVVEINKDVVTKIGGNQHFGRFYNINSLYFPDYGHSYIKKCSLYYSNDYNYSYYSKVVCSGHWAILGNGCLPKIITVIML